MTTNSDVVERWFQEVTKDHPRFIGTQTSNNIYPAEWKGVRKLYSWGSHFTLVELVKHRNGDFFLVNGDSYSNSTTQHQGEVRSAAMRHELPYIIIPFSALYSAGIDHETIVPTFIEPDRIDKIQHSSVNYDDLPNWVSRRFVVPVGGGEGSYEPVEPGEDGLYHWTTDDHFLGASGFRASWSSQRYGPVDKIGYFLSAFDEGEPGRSYFLCQLPRKAESYAQALELLKPEAVTIAENEGLTVVRQGDIFAIPTTFTTKGLFALQPENDRTKIEKMGRLLGTSHVATKVLHVDGQTFAQGIMWHKPTGWNNRPEHVRKVMGDRKTWHLIVQNTVPKDKQTGQPRGWQIQGRVD